MPWQSKENENKVRVGVEEDIDFGEKITSGLPQSIAQMMRLS